MTRGSEFGVFANAPAVRFLVVPQAFSRARARSARGVREGVGREGPRLPRLRRERRGALADREVPLRGRARGVPARAGLDRPLRRRRAGAGLARARRASPAPRPRARADRRRGLALPLDHRLPAVRVGRGRRGAGRPSTIRSRGRPRGARLARDRPGRRDRRGLRPRRERERARRRLVPDPRARAPGSRSSTCSRISPDEQRAKFGFLLDALAHGRAAPRRHRLRDRPDDDGAGRRAEHPRHDRVPEEPGRDRPDERRADARSGRNSCASSESSSDRIRAKPAGRPADEASYCSLRAGAAGEWRPKRHVHARSRRASRPGADLAAAHRGPPVSRRRATSAPASRRPSTPSAATSPRSRRSCACSRPRRGSASSSRPATPFAWTPST